MHPNPRLGAGHALVALSILAMASLPALSANAAQSAHTGGRPLSASLSGPIEVPPGDPDGGGQVTLTVHHGKGQGCFALFPRRLGHRCFDHRPCPRGSPAPPWRRCLRRSRSCLPHAGGLGPSPPSSSPACEAQTQGELPVRPCAPSCRRPMEP